MNGQTQLVAFELLFCIEADWSEGLVIIAIVEFEKSPEGRLFVEVFYEYPELLFSLTVLKQKDNPVSYLSISKTFLFELVLYLII